MKTFAKGTHKHSFKMKKEYQFLRVLCFKTELDNLNLNNHNTLNLT